MAVSDGGNSSIFDHHCLYLKRALRLYLLHSFYWSRYVVNPSPQAVDRWSRNNWEREGKVKIGWGKEAWWPRLPSPATNSDGFDAKVKSPLVSRLHLLSKISLFYKWRDIQFFPKLPIFSLLMTDLLDCLREHLKWFRHISQYVSHNLWDNALLQFDIYSIPFHTCYHQYLRLINRQHTDLSTSCFVLIFGLTALEGCRQAWAASGNMDVCESLTCAVNGRWTPRIQEFVLR